MEKERSDEQQLDTDLVDEDLEHAGSADLAQDELDEDLDDGCMCEWPDGCAGLGVLQCRGCGGDLCVCTCGGEIECDGCEDCSDGQREDK